MAYRNMSEDYKIDVCLNGRYTAATEATPVVHYPMKGYDKALFIVSAGTFGLGTTDVTSFNLVARTLQAKTSTGTAITLGSSSVFALGTTDQEIIDGAEYVTIVCASSPAHGDYITVNGVTFTWSTDASAATAMSTSRLLPATSDGYIQANTLSSYINHATYGCADLIAIPTSNSDLTTIYSDPRGEKAIDVTLSRVGTSSSGPAMMSVGRVIGYMEIDARDLASSSDYTHVSIGVTPASSFSLNVTLIRGSGARYSPPRGQYVQDYDDVI